MTLLGDALKTLPCKECGSACLAHAVHVRGRPGQEGFRSREYVFAPEGY